MATEYPEQFVTRLEILWGEGFLSAGGPAEVNEILKGVDISGKTVLDLGCGCGGPDIVLVNDLAAAKVVGIDIDAGLLDRARGYARAAGLIDKIHYSLVYPGPLPIADNAFDIVFSKEAIIQIPDKEARFGRFCVCCAPAVCLLRVTGWVGKTATHRLRGRAFENSHIGRASL
jgi:cyclopropane fatty-acyl-phospholipid synthase-like methyltransferase